MNLTCPLCHASFSLETLVQDESARELMVIVARAGSTGPLLVAYLGLFRSKSRALAWDRALRLAKEVTDLGADPRALAAALAETVEAMRRKREAGQVKPLKDHAYLRRVLESVGATPVAALSPPPEEVPAAPKGKRRLALEVLAAWAGDDWLRVEICHGLQALLANPALRDAPAADVIEYTAGLFETVLSARVNIPEVDQGRVEAAFKELLKRRLERWPEPADVLAELPRRPDRQKIADDREIGEEARQKGREFFSQMAGGKR